MGYSPVLFGIVLFFSDQMWGNVVGALIAVISGYMAVVKFLKNPNFPPPLLQHGCKPMKNTKSYITESWLMMRLTKLK